MKRILLVFLALFVLLAGSACEKGQSDVPDGMLRASNQALSFWMFYPERWEIRHNAESLCLISDAQLTLSSQYSEELKDGEAYLPSNLANLTVYRLEEEYASLDEYLAGDYKAGFDASYVFEGEGERSTLGRDEMCTFVYHRVGGEGQVLYRYLQSAILHEGRVYLATFCATVDHFLEYESVVREMIGSITFEAVSENSPLTSRVDAVHKEEEPYTVEDRCVLTNLGVDFCLVYPTQGWRVSADTGYLAVTAEDGASVSVTRGDAYAVAVQTLADYMDLQFYPMLSSLYGEYEELSRKELDEEHLSRVGASLGLQVTYRAEIAGESYTFLQALYWRGGYVYSLLYTAQDAHYEAHLSEVETMVSELKLK